MTRKKIYSQIAAFLDKDWNRAREYEKVFFENCMIPVSQITDLRLSYGKFSRMEGGNIIYFGENRNALHFHYVGVNPWDKFHFSILR